MYTTLDEATLSQFAKLTSLRNLHYQSWINFDAKSSEESVKSASVLSHLDQAAAESIGETICFSDRNWQKKNQKEFIDIYFDISSADEYFN